MRGAGINANAAATRNQASEKRQKSRGGKRGMQRGKHGVKMTACKRNRRWRAAPCLKAYKHPKHGIFARSINGNAAPSYQRHGGISIGMATA